MDGTSSPSGDEQGDSTSQDDKQSTSSLGGNNSPVASPFPQMGDSSHQGFPGSSSMPAMGNTPHNTVDLKQSAKLFSPGELVKSALNPVLGETTQKQQQEDQQKAQKDRQSVQRAQQEAQAAQQKKFGERQQQKQENIMLKQQLLQMGASVPEHTGSSKTEATLLTHMINDFRQEKARQAMARSQAPKGKQTGAQAEGGGEGGGKSSMMDRMTSGGQESSNMDSSKQDSMQRQMENSTPGE